MSKTIKPNKKTKEKFFTSINSEQLIGNICYIANTKCFTMQYPDLLFIDMAYEMDKFEAIHAINKIKNTSYIEHWDYLKRYFGKDCTYDDLCSFILEFVDFLEESKGYKCI